MITAMNLISTQSQGPQTDNAPDGDCECTQLLRIVSIQIVVTAEEMRKTKDPFELRDVILQNGKRPIYAHVEAYLPFHITSWTVGSALAEQTVRYTPYEAQAAMNQAHPIMKSC